MSGTEPVVKVSGTGEFRGDNSAAEPLVALQNQNLLARGGHVGGGNQSVVPGSDRDNVVVFSH